MINLLKRFFPVIIVFLLFLSRMIPRMRRDRIPTTSSKRCPICHTTSFPAPKDEPLLRDVSNAVWIHSGRVPTRTATVLHPFNIKRGSFSINESF